MILDERWHAMLAVEVMSKGDLAVDSVTQGGVGSRNRCLCTMKDGKDR